MPDCRGQIYREKPRQWSLTFHDLLPLPGLFLIEANVYLPQYGQLPCDNGPKNGDSHFVSLLLGANTVRYVLSFPLTARKLPELTLYPIKGSYIV